MVEGCGGEGQGGRCSALNKAEEAQKIWGSHLAIKLPLTHYDSAAQNISQT